MDTWLVLSGDLHPNRITAEAQIAEYRRMGITDIIDCREEWSDAELVAEIAPEITYWHIGTHDNGGDQPDAWFAAGVEAYYRAMAKPNAKILVHCHMGINRGPSMGLRLMLEHDPHLSPAECVTAIREARPIARIHYGEAAARHHFATSRVTATAQDRVLSALRDALTVDGSDNAIHLIRQAEAWD